MARILLMHRVQPTAERAICERQQGWHSADLGHADEADRGVCVDGRAKAKTSLCDSEIVRVIV